MAIVPQDVLLFGGSIAENIRYGRTDASLEKSEQLQEGIALGFIEEFPDGFDTVVGERGGSAQWRSTAASGHCACFSEGSFDLILDEATSALDSHSEAEVQKSAGGANERTHLPDHCPPAKYGPSC